MKKIKSVFILAAVTILLFSCTTDEIVGPVGATGLSGSANIYNEIDTIKPIQWSPKIGNYYYDTINVPQIISETSDVVLAYVNTGTSYTPLPCTSVLSVGDYMTFSYSNAILGISYEGNSLPTTNCILKIVVMPPALKAIHPNVNYKNYNEVRQTFNLKD